LIKALIIKISELGLILNTQNFVIFGKIVV